MSSPLCPPPPSPPAVTTLLAQPTELSSGLSPQVDDELEIKAYYAGHVLGAAMFQIKVGSESVVYTVSGCPWGTGGTAWPGNRALSLPSRCLPG